MTVSCKSFRKLLATAATATMVATAIVPSVSAASFIDVPDSYKDAVDYLAAKEISKGVTESTYGTYLNIKRSDAAIMIVRALGLENYEAPESGFEDVPASAVKAVNVLKDLDIVSGKSTTIFGSSDPLTRAEMAKIISLTYELPVEGQAHPFVDVSPAFNEHVQALYNAGITVGTGDTSYGSSNPITRGQFAIFLNRAELFEYAAPDILVSDVYGVINEDGTITISGKAEEVNEVTIVLPNGDAEIVLEAEVANGEFAVTTDMPAAGIQEITILDGSGNVLYEGIRDEAEVSAAGMAGNGPFTFKDANLVID